MTIPVSRFAPSILALASQAALVAAAVAAMPAPALADTAKAVHCYGVNSCKGQSDCATAKNSCKGQNTCKGQGFKAESKDKCMADGGSLTAPK